MEQMSTRVAARGWASNAGSAMTPLGNRLRVALLANAKMREGAERLLQGYLTPNSDRAAIMIS